MKLVITSKEAVLDKRFINHLIKFIPIYLKRFIEKDRKRLSAYTEYINQNLLTGKVRYTSEKLLRVGIRNLRVNYFENTAFIEINKTAIVPYYPKVKIADICDFIDSGNLEITGTHIITDFFTFIRNNIYEFRNRYEQGLF